MVKSVTAGPKEGLVLRISQAYFQGPPKYARKSQNASVQDEHRPTSYLGSRHKGVGALESSIFGLGGDVVEWFVELSTSAGLVLSLAYWSWNDKLSSA